MQNLFTVTESFEVELNKEWIMMVPAFNAILKADKGSPGDSEGRKKLKARKQLGYIYFMEDFKSPIYGYEDSERHAEALRYVGLDAAETELDLVREALREYSKMQMGQARSLRTLKAAKKGLDALDNYLENVDFDARDKQGKLVNSPKEYVNNLQNLNKAYDELTKFEKRVYEELKDSSAIRGRATMGDREMQRDEKVLTWEEGSEKDYNVSAPAFGDLSIELNKTRKPIVDRDLEEDEDELS